ncbi:hypothetical protein MRX96_010530 [Rhipicephalus microplus]
MMARNVQQMGDGPISNDLNGFLGRVPVKGQLKVSVTYAGKTINATLVVLNYLGPNLWRWHIILPFQVTGGPVLNVDSNNGALPRTHSAAERVWYKNYDARAAGDPQWYRLQGVPS